MPEEMTPEMEAAALAGFAGNPIAQAYSVGFAAATCEQEEHLAAVARVAELERELSWENLVEMKVRIRELESENARLAPPLGISAMFDRAAAILSAHKIAKLERQRDEVLAWACTLECEDCFHPDNEHSLAPRRKTIGRCMGQSGSCTCTWVEVPVAAGIRAIYGEAK